MTREEALNILDTQLHGTQEDLESYGAFACAEALRTAIKALEQDPCDDAISREQLLATMFDLPKPKTNKTYWDGVDDVGELVNNLPSIQPKQRTGHWEWVKYANYTMLGDWVCSECKSVAVECVRKDNKGGIPSHKYCPNCGAKMQEVEE